MLQTRTLDPRARLGPLLRTSALVATTLLVPALLALPLQAESAGGRNDAAAEAGLSLETRIQLLQVLQESQAQTLRLIDRAGEEHWDRRPAPERWSVAEVVEHLLRAEELLQKRVRKMLASDPSPNWSAIESASVSELIVFGSDRSTRFQAPQIIQPTGALDRASGVAQLVAARLATIDWLIEAEGPFEAVIEEAPTGHQLSVSGWVAFIAAHTVRHNAQIAEALEQLGVSSGPDGTSAD